MSHIAWTIVGLTLGAMTACSAAGVYAELHRLPGQP